MKLQGHIVEQLVLKAIIVLALWQTTLNGQEEQANFNLDNSFHNQLFFNRYLLNPTFSLVRENKSYLNVMIRNQYAAFENNPQYYYLGFSNQLNENTAIGLGVNGRWSGVMQEFGLLANYATAIRLGAKNKLTLGTNITYTSSGLNRNNIIGSEQDPTLNDIRKENRVTIQPALTLSLGNFDFGVFARNLMRYNQTTNTLSTNLTEKNLSFFAQYVFNFNAKDGLFRNARFLPLLEWGKNELDNWSYLGSVLLDFPSYGWLQMSFDDTYGLSYGLGFDLGKKLSLGYLMEKELNETGTNLGWNHEMSLAYSFKEGTSSNIRRTSSELSSDAHVDQIVRNYEEQILQLKEDRTNAQTNESVEALVHQNKLILDELLLRQDSMEKARNADFERRFDTAVRLLRNEIKKSQPPQLKNEVSYSKAKTAPQTRAVKRPVPKSAPEKQDNDYVPLRKVNFREVPGISSGYYLIANVYRNKKYLEAYMVELKQKGFSPQTFYNPSNGLNYLYLANFKDEKQARLAMSSNLNNTYMSDMWLIEISNPRVITGIEFE